MRPLNDYEAGILRALCIEGKDRDRIAEELNVAKGTLQDTIGTIRIKLAASHMEQAAYRFGLLNRYVPPDDVLLVKALSERQNQVLQGLCVGLKRMEVSDSLHISGKTYDKHVDRAKHQTESKTVCELVHKYTLWDSWRTKL